MRKLLLTGFDDAMQDVGQLTLPLQEDYARRHGFEFLCLRQFHSLSHPSWQTGVAVAAALHSYDWVLWLGADVLVTNPEFDIFSLDLCQGLNVSRDWGVWENDPWSFSCGSHLSGPLAFSLWQTAHELWPKWSNTPLWEQSALREVVRMNSTWMARHIKVHPRRVFNAVPREIQKVGDVAEPWQPGDWLCHVTGLPMKDKRDHLLRMIASKEYSPWG